ncbi:MAG: hypothetical protein ACOZF2_15995 [Thermodesulfobacteriota bacterium]
MMSIPDDDRPSARLCRPGCPEVLLPLFHPRPELALFNPPTTAQEMFIPVAPGVAAGGRFYAAGPQAPTLLFFHEETGFRNLEKNGLVMENFLDNYIVIMTI